MVISSPCLTDIKNWLVQSKRLLLASPEQTASGKDFSNPLIVDSLLKTIWLSMHHVVTMKHWLFQSKRLLELFLGEDATRAIPNMGFNLVDVEGFFYLEIEVVCVEFGCHFEVELECMSGFGIGEGELTLSSLDVVQGFSFFLQMGFTLILATLGGLDVCLLGDVIGEDNCDDDD
ncbi:hypothetical protein Tco_1062872 [Tanacetum coccineum]